MYMYMYMLYMYMYTCTCACTCTGSEPHWSHHPCRQGRRRCLAVTLTTLPDCIMLRVLLTLDDANHLGITLTDRADSETRTGGGARRVVVVEELVAGDAAALAGLAPGDVIISVNGRDVYTHEEAIELMQTSSAVETSSAIELRVRHSPEQPAPCISISSLIVLLGGALIGGLLVGCLARASIPTHPLQSKTLQPKLTLSAEEQQWFSKAPAWAREFANEERPTVAIPERQARWSASQPSLDTSSSEQTAAEIFSKAPAWAHEYAEEEDRGGGGVAMQLPGRRRRAQTAARRGGSANKLRDAHGDNVYRDAARWTGHAPEPNRELAR